MFGRKDKPRGIGDCVVKRTPLESAVKETCEKSVMIIKTEVEETIDVVDLKDKVRGVNDELAGREMKHQESVGDETKQCQTPLLYVVHKGMKFYIPHGLFSLVFELKENIKNKIRHMYRNQIKPNTANSAGLTNIIKVLTAEDLNCSESDDAITEVSANGSIVIEKPMNIVEVKNDDLRKSSDQEKGRKSTPSFLPGTLKLSLSNNDEGLLITSDSLRTDERQVNLVKYPLTNLDNSLEEPTTRTVVNDSLDNSREETVTATVVNNSLKEHVTEVKDEGSLFECIVCGERLKSFEDYNDHLTERHSESGVERVRCLICDEAVEGKLISAHHALYHARQLQQSDSCVTNFPCSICDSHLATADAWIIHSRRHFETRKFRCQICNIDIKTVRSYGEHLLLHNISNNYDCERCERRFSLSTAMHAHECSRSKGFIERRSCEFQDVDFEGDAFMQNIDDDESADDPTETPDDQRRPESTCESSLTPVNVTSEPGSSMISERISSETCDHSYSLAAFDGVSFHGLKRTIEPEDKAPKKKKKADRIRKTKKRCPYCEFTTVFPDSYNEHMKSNHPVEEVGEGMYMKRLSYPCEECDDTRFRTQTALRTHRRDVHGLPCEICGDYCFKELWRGHVRLEHHLSYSCQHCGASFPNRRKRCSHIANKHTSATYLCTSCGEYFPTRRSLHRHNSCNVNGGKKQCVECGFYFSKLDEHINAKHTDADRKQIYMCDVCDEVYRSYAGLSSHRNRKHPGFLFACEICEYRAKTRHQVKVHYDRVHISDDMKPFTCPFDHCDRKFSTERLVTAHTYTHGTKYKSLNMSFPTVVNKRVERTKNPLKCPHCPLTFVSALRYGMHLVTHGSE